MTRHPSERALNDYVDGLLREPDRARVEAHLAACPRCREEEAALRALVASLGRLPGAVAPPRDLRADIAERIAAGGAERVPARWRRGRMAYAVLAAAAVLVLLAVPLVRDGMDGGDTDNPPAAGSGGELTSQAVAREFTAAEARYTAATAELEEALESSRGQVSAEAEVILDRNLKVVDTALRDYRQALAEQPADAELAALTLSAYEQKLSLLRGALESTEAGDR